MPVNVLFWSGRIICWGILSYRWTQTPEKHYSCDCYHRLSVFETCRRAFKAGILEFFKKPINSELLVNAIHDAFNQYENSLTKYHGYQRVKDKFSKLSAREKEVMDMILEGNTSKEAAQKLSLSPRTVEVHRSNMYTKLRIKSLLQLVQEYDFYKNYSDSIWAFPFL